jgi:putative tryptophan/tyrosine transport system substrate-binding protein
MAIDIQRREFIFVLGGATVAWPLAARAQHRRGQPTVGFLAPTTPSIASERIAVFARRLRELGWIEGQTIAIEYRWAGGNTKRFAEIAAEFVQLKVDVIATWGTATAVAAMQATSAIPIIFTIVGDPVGSGLVASLAHPGGNVTGLSTQHAETAGKRLELLREVVPNLHRLAIMANIGNSGPAEEMHEVRAKARMLGLEVTPLEIRRAEDIAPGIEALKGQAQALYVAGDALINSNRDRINSLALDARLPTMHGFREITAAGGLMSYAPNYPDLFRRAADYVDKILRGTKPAEIPVEQPTRFDFVVNLRTAKTLGLEIPPKVLALTDEVIE